MYRQHFTGLFTDKNVVLTGAGNGIGRSALLAFHEAGANIVAHLGRNAGYAKDLPEGIVTTTADLTDPDEQQRFTDIAAEHFSQVHVLVNNAGTMFGRFPAESLTDTEYEQIVQLNQHAVVRITRGLLPQLKSAAPSAIVNTVSISATTGGSPGSSIYSASKAFVATYSKALARELAPAGIRVNAVSPGVIATDFHKRYSSAEKLENTRKQIPLQRLGNADDCAPAFLFLAASELSGYITGQVLEINGGQL